MRIPNYAGRSAKDGSQATGKNLCGELRSQPEKERARTATREIDIALALAAVMAAAAILWLPMAALTW